PRAVRRDRHRPRVPAPVRPAERGSDAGASPARHRSGAPGGTVAPVQVVHRASTARQRRDHPSEAGVAPRHRHRRPAADDPLAERRPRLRPACEPAMTGRDDPTSVRLDKWLWAARFYKTRTAATEAVHGGKVEVNGESAKPARAVVPG